MACANFLFSGVPSAAVRGVVEISLMINSGQISDEST
jgi:hypothetical protein